MNLPKQTLLDIPSYLLSFLVETHGGNATQDATPFIAVLRSELCCACLTSRQWSCSDMHAKRQWSLRIVLHCHFMSA